MSEQSGPITREQVERAIAKPRNIDYRELPLWWREWAPDYVIAAEAADDWDAEHAALTRWRDELAAAEPVRRVARWDAERASGIGAYVCTPPYEFVGSPGHQHPIIPSQQRHLLEAAGYEIEGGPEPVRDWKSDRAIAAIWPTPKPAEDSPERLRERREALGWTTAYAGHWVPWFDHTDVERAESGKGIPAFVARYAAALSAEEARRAAVGGVLHYSPPTEPERPAPRFKVGDWVRVNDLGSAHHGHTYQIAEIYGSWHRKVRGDLDCSYMARNLEPASPPAPEVVDVPQPALPLPWLDDLARRLTGMAEHFARQAKHGGRAWESNALSETTCRDGVEAVTALRAMLAAIDARQGGAS